MYRHLLLFLFLAINFSPGFSQTGPGGVGNSSNNIIWLDASTIGGTDGADVTTWTDISGNGVSFGASSSGNLPDFETGEINGLPVVEFRDTNAERLVVNPYNNMASTQISTLIVFATPNTNEGILSYSVGNGNASNEFLLFNAGNLGTYVKGTNNNGGDFSDGATTFNILASTWNSSNGALRHYKNGSNVNSATIRVGASITNGGSFAIGGEQDQVDGGYAANQNMTGKIAEVILYNTVLNDGERIVLENYLANKYGITITDDYFGNYTDYTAAYNDDLRGVGTGNGTDAHSISGFSSGLQLEATNGLDAVNEFAIFAHNGSVAHADGSVNNIAAADISSGAITERWAKDYFVEVSQNGTVDAASIETEFVFDFSEAGLTYTGSSSDYVLLYRATTADDFSRVFAYDYVVENGDQVVVSIAASRLQSGYYTLGRGTQITTRKWYVLQNGDWSDSNTWTLDAGSAPVPNNPLNETPGEEDDVIIRNGKTVTIQSTNNNLTVGSIIVDGSLDVTTSSGHNFNFINGQGTILISGSGGVSNFPDGNTTTSNGFGNPANGGLLSVRGSGFVFDEDETFKDVRFLLDNATDVIELGADLTINGYFNVRFGTLQFGDGSGVNRTFTVLGDFTVESNGGAQDGRVTTANVPSSNARHEFNLYGDFLNEGTAQFSDRTAVNYNSESSNGVVDMNLVSVTSDQRVDCNGLTYFYRIEINKGSVDFTADIQADDPGNFVLTGYANRNIGGDVDEPSDNTNAFGLITGSVSLGTNVSVRLNITGNYSIGSNARLIVDGAMVTKTGGAAITPYGTLEVQAGILEVPSGSGVTTRGNGQITVSGGQLWACQIRTSVNGSSAQGGFLQTGGTVNVWDYSSAESPILGQAAGTASGSYARFCLTYEGNSFAMSGGILNVKNATGRGLIFINSSPDNINVQGGTVNAYSSAASSSVIASNAGFWDFNVIQESTGSISIETATCGPGGADDRTITDPDLVVLSDLSIGTDAQLVMNDNDLYIGEDFTIAENVRGVTYQSGANTTYFNGALSGLVTLNSTEAAIGSGRLDFNNVVLDKESNNGLYFSYNLPNFGGNVVRVDGDITIESGFWNQGEENLDLQGGNITNKGILGVYEVGVADGEIILRSDPVNIVTTDGAQFGYVRDNNRFDINLTSDVYIQRLRWRRGLWYLGSHNLKIDQLDIRPNTDTNGSDYVDEDGTTVCENCLSVNYMFATDGNVSDGGLSLMMPSTGINGAILRSDNGDATRDIFDYRGNVVANTTGGGAGDNLFIFPLGVGLSRIDIEFGDPSGTTTADTSKYSPVYLRVEDVTGVTEDSVYITMRPVDQELQTTDLSGGDVLSYYWNVGHGYTGTAPTVTLDMNYYTDDLDGSLNEALFVAGKVEDGGVYLRNYEDDNVPENEGVDLVNKIVTFNGNTDAGLVLSNSNYTAGESARFVGSPQVFYTRVPGDGFGRKWNNGNNWTFAPNDIDGNSVVDDYELHDSRQPAAGDFPQAGDVAVIGWVPFGDPGGDDGDPHGIAVDGIVANFAEIRFTQMKDNSGNPTARQYAYNFQFRPTVVINNAGGALNGSRIAGEGLFWMRWGGSQADPDFSNVDIGGFVSQDSAYFVYESKNGTYNNMPAEVPNLLLASDGWGNNNRNCGVSTNLHVRSNLEILGDLNLILSSGASGDIVVDNDLRIFRNNANGNDSGGNGRIDYPNSASRTIEVFGDLRLENQSAIVSVANPNTTQNVGHLIVHGDIVQDVTSGGGLQLYTAANEDCVQLTLKGSGKHGFNPVSGADPSLYSIILDKGSDTTSVFTIASNFTLPTPADIGFQPIEIINGLLVLDDPSIDVILADGTQGDFYLPNILNSEAASGSGGLEVAQGTASISGDDVGIILDGLLRVSGGTMDLSVTGDNGNNFIEYGGSDNAVIEVTDGALLVGSQVRRKLTAVSGLLNYAQSGGIARFGIEAAPEITRGVFELINSGSEFIHTGGEFTIVRENGSTTVGSLIIKPDPADFDTTGSTITFGSADTPAGQDEIGIDSNVPLNEIIVTGNNSPTVVIFNADLEVNSLTIESGGTFNANGYDLTVNGDIDNDGVFENGGTVINQQTTYMPADAAQEILGLGTTNFYNLEKGGSGTLTLSKSVTVSNDLMLLDGTVNTDTYALNIEGNMMHNAIHECAAAGPGIVFNGSEVQNLDTSTDTGEFGVLTLDNSNGLEIPGDGRIFQVNTKIVLNAGVFNIGGNLLIMNEDAFFENGIGGTSRTDFNVNSMISVNASITDNGVRKIFNDAFTGTFLYPIGLNYYTPSEVNVTGISGGNASEITIKPIEDIAGGIPDDTDETCFGDNSDYVDVDNILQFYWLIKSANVVDFDGSIFLYHVDALEAVDNTQGLGLANYAPARLLDVSSTWDKGYSEALFDETNNVSMFQTNSTTDYANFTSDDLTGTYTAGITRDNSDVTLCGGAIPDVVPEYITLSTATSGDVDNVASYATAPGGTAPSLGESPDLRVSGDFTLNLTSEFWRFRKVTIEEGATLTISGAGANLGTVNGTGTLKLINTNGLPAGDYSSFEADVACSTGGGFELEVTTGNSVSLALPFDRLRRLILTGDGEKILSNSSSFSICENLEILDAGTLTLGDNTSLNIQENVIKSPTATFDGDFNNARVVLDGSSQQQIDGAFEGVQAFIMLELDNASGMTILNGANDNVEIENLEMTLGKVTTDLDNSLIILNTGDVTGNFSNTTFVDGPLKRRLETTNDRQLFPVGSGSVYLPFEVSNTQGYTGTKDWMVQYHEEDPGTAVRITNVNATYDFSTWGGETNDVNSQLFRQDLFEVEVASPATADVRPYWDSDTDVGSGTNDWQNLRVMVWDVTNETWESYGNGNLTYSGMTASSGSVISDTDLSFSTNFVTLGSNEPVPLPVELVFFQAELLDGGSVELTWQTASEISNDRFEVQRVASDGEFETIGSVLGAGDSKELLDYSFIDSSPYNGINYYRLKQIDFDGQFEYSELIMINNDNFFEGIDVIVYPNPVIGNEIGLIIETGDELSDIELVLMDASGRTLDRTTKNPVLGVSNYQMEMRRGEIGSGLFYLIVLQGENKKVMRVIVH